MYRGITPFKQIAASNGHQIEPDLFLYSYESKFFQNLVKYKNLKEIARSFNFTYRHIDNVLKKIPCVAYVHLPSITRNERAY